MKVIESPKTGRLKCQCGAIIQLPNLPGNESVVYQCQCGSHYEISAGSIHIRIYPSRKAWRDEVVIRKKRGILIPSIQSAQIIKQGGE